MKEALNNAQIQHFINKGYICIENAFSEDLAKECRTILWHDLGLSPDDPSTWTQPVVWLGMYSQEPFIKAANTDVLHSAFNQLVGENNWIPCMSVGSFPVRFPSKEDPGGIGWHVDSGFAGDNPSNYFEWRINVKSKGRALLMLFLFSDVSVNDAPTRLKSGSHLDVAKILESEGDSGLSFMELAAKVEKLPGREEVLATGKAGTVYLCHPFIVHSAQPHKGTEPKFMAQPPLLLKNELAFKQGEMSVLEKSIIHGLSL